MSKAQTSKAPVKRGPYTRRAKPNRCTCEVCGGKFQAIRPEAKFCRPACRAAAGRKRRADQAAAELTAHLYTEVAQAAAG
jgi:hypothetical protein